jgi:hypothetical protein
MSRDRPQKVTPHQLSGMQALMDVLSRLPTDQILLYVEVGLLGDDGEIVPVRTTLTTMH